MASTKYAINESVLSDARGIAEVHVASWQATYRGIMPDELLDGLSVEKRERDWAEWIEQKKASIWVAHRDGRVVAFVCCTLDESVGVATMVALYVLPECLGLGIGHALFERAVSALKETDCTGVELWVAAKNQGASSFYRRQGMTLNGRQKALNFGGRQVDTVGYSLAWD